MKKLGHNPDRIEELVDQANNGEEAVTLFMRMHEIHNH